MDPDMDLDLGDLLDGQDDADGGAGGVERETARKLQKLRVLDEKLAVLRAKKAKWHAAVVEERQQRVQAENEVARMRKSMRLDQGGGGSPGEMLGLP